MKNLITISLILNFLSCSTLNITPGVYSSDMFKPYTNAYLEYKQIYLNKKNFNYPITIVFKHLPDRIIGTCTKYLPPFSRKIEIDYVTWAKYSDDERLQLMFHELGHCDLDFPDQDERVGIMNSSTNLKRLKHVYIENLFKKGL